VVRNGQVPRGPSPWCGTLKVQGPRVNDRRVGAAVPVGRILPPYLCRWPKVAEVLVWYLPRDGCPPPGARDAARRRRTSWRLTAVCGMLRGVAAVSQAQPGWMPVRVRVGEGGAIRCRSQTELDTRSVEYLVQPQLRTRPTAALPVGNTGPRSRHGVQSISLDIILVLELHPIDLGPRLALDGTPRGVASSLRRGKEEAS
jgi:hypothetical protein